MLLTLNLMKYSNVKLDMTEFNNLIGVKMIFG